MKIWTIDDTAKIESEHFEVVDFSNVLRSKGLNEVILSAMPLVSFEF